MTTEIVNRGGSWYSSADYCRSANRGWDLPSFRYDILGFRVIREKKKKVEYRVLRGGSWYSTAGYCRSASRYWYSPPSRYSNDGFRVIKESKDDN